MTKKKVFPEQLHENIDLKNKRLWLFKTYICAESQEKENKNICWTLPKLTTDILWRSFLVFLLPFFEMSFVFYPKRVEEQPLSKKTKTVGLGSLPWR